MISELNQEYLCMGCGTCVSICSTDCIRMELRDGQYYPKMDKTKCIKCNKCINACPGISIPLKSIANELWPDNKWDSRLGKFRETYVGHSNNSKIRFEAASGGIATSLALWLIRTKVVNGVILTRMRNNDPLQSESFIACTEEEIISAQTSKYCPSSTVALIRELKNSNVKEKFAFVGLPCQIHGVRKLQKQEKWIKNKIRLTIGIFCSHGVTFSGTNLILSKFANGSENIERIQYRGRGWPGGICVRYKNGAEFNIPLEEYWPPFFAPYFFTPYRCLTCHDLTSELADISLGDAWLKEVKEKDNMGTSIIIARSSQGKEILTSMKQDDEISLREIPYEKVIESQQGILARKKRGVGARIKLLKILFKPTPKYDQEFKPSLSGYAGAILIYSNAMMSKAKFGQKILEIIPIKFLKKYHGYILKYGGK